MKKTARLLHRSEVAAHGDLNVLLTWVQHHTMPLSIIGIVALNCLLWRPFLNAPLHVDAAGYALAAYWWARGDTLYQDMTITRPQGIFVIFRTIEALGLGSPRGIHLTATIWSILCTLTLLIIVNRVWGRREGIGAALIFTLLISTPTLEAPTANAELFMLLPLLLSLWALLQSEDAPPSSPYNLFWLMLCGGSGAVALLIKPSGFVALPLAMLWIIRQCHTKGMSRTTWLRMEIALAFGFLLSLVPAILHGLLTSFAGAALGGNWYPHYFLQLLPPLAVALALVIQIFVRRIRNRSDVIIHGLLFVTIGQLVVVLLSAQMVASDPTKLMIKTEPRSFTPATISTPIVTYLHNHTTPDERIYVAYHQADLYYLAQRRPAARWLYAPELKLFPDAFNEQVALINAPSSAPRYIVAIQPFDAFGLDPEGTLRVIVARDYERETTIEGIDLYRRKGN